MNIQRTEDQLGFNIDSHFSSQRGLTRLLGGVHEMNGGTRDRTINKFWMFCIDCGCVFRSL